MRSLDGVSLVYFIGRRGDIIQIGHTLDVWTWLVSGGQLLGYIRGGLVEHAAICQRFAALHVGVGLYRSDPDLLRFIAERCEHVAPPVERAAPVRLSRPRGLSLALGFMRAMFGGKRVAR